MALKLQFASLSLSAAVDQQTGSPSVFDVIEEIRAPQLPIQLQTLVIAMSVEKTTTEAYTGKLYIHLPTPEKKQHLIGNGDVNIPAEQKRMRALFRFGGFPVNQFGEHRFVVSWLNQGGIKQGEAILDFEVIQATQVAQATPGTSTPPISGSQLPN